MYFKKISIDNLNEIKQHMNKLSYFNSESAVANMYIWDNEYYSNSFCLDKDILFVKCDLSDNLTWISMPYCKPEYFKNATENIIEHFNQIRKKAIINFADDKYLDFIKSNYKDRFIYNELRNSYDYIYNISDLINLRGKKFHSKKNHINSFNKKYSFEYVHYNPEMHDTCVDFCYRVINSNLYSDEKAKQMEKESVKRVFEIIEIANLRASMLMIGNKIIALTVGSKLNDKFAIIHVEKALPEFREAYAVINNLFLKNEFDNLEYVNREDDMGLEGLRKAKLSYHPCNFVKKYRIEFI